MKSVTIGRHPGCDITLGDAHVSRRHATVFYNGDGFHVHNLSQTNPIIFNDRWTLNHGLKADLKPGDTFTIGRVRMKVTLPDVADGISGPGEPAPAIKCPSCGQQLFDKRATCPLCRASINETETVLIANDA
jgi:predicted component of type VI protein secretion system